REPRRTYGPTHVTCVALATHCRRARRHPRISPLFPYTTLFRSSLSFPARRQKVRQRPRQLINLVLGVIPMRTHSDQGPLRVSTQDRKSTRLNSSHVAISYAVFCLKKQK